MAAAHGFIPQLRDLRERAGYDAHVAKPVNPERLIAAVAGGVVVVQLGVTMSRVAQDRYRNVYLPAAAAAMGPARGPRMYARIPAVISSACPIQTSVTASVAS